MRLSVSVSPLINFEATGQLEPNLTGRDLKGIRLQQNSWKQAQRDIKKKTKPKPKRKKNTPKNREASLRSCSCELIKHWDICESVTDWLDTCPSFSNSFNWSSQFASLQSQSASWNRLMGGQLWLQSYFYFFFFVSCWLNSKLKVEGLISCRDSCEECVLPGISPAISSFPCVKGVKRCSFVSRTDSLFSFVS